jgi:hypothetical protein
MMHCLESAFSLLLLAHRGLTSTAPTRGARFGISFGSNTIMTTKFNLSGSIELTAIPASLEYQMYYRGAVPKSRIKTHDIDEAKVRSIIEHAMAPMTEKLRQQLGYAPEYATLFMPSIFDYKTFNAASDAIYPDVPYVTKRGPSRTAACFGYGFLEGKNLGRPAEDCNEDGPPSFILLLEYESEYIYVWLMDVTYELGLYSVEQEMFCGDCGEGEREVNMSCGFRGCAYIYI